MSQLRTTELDFDQIRENLKNFFKTSVDSSFRDWDFDGSALSTLLDVLAYNTQYNAMLAHMAVNETFLESSQIRKNVVAHAKLLGYIPHSAKAARAALTVSFTGSGVTQLTLPRGSAFTTSIDGASYTFVTLQNYTAPSAGGQYVFGSQSSPVLVHQGVIRTARYTVDENVPIQKFVIDDSNVDISTLRVSVKVNATSSVSETFVPFSSLALTDGDSPIYFISENSDGKYELYFGDGIFGKKLLSQSRVEIEYLSTLGGVGNFANAFVFAGSLNGFSTPTIEVVSAASAGGSRESTESVRFNAPLNLIAQNRAVTADDYKALILREYGAVDAVNVWGGENQPEPEYGKVFISVKPLNALTLSDNDKITIVTMLKTKNVLTITPVMVDPDYVNIYMDVLFKYDSNLTARSGSELQSSVRSVIDQFNEDELQRFDGVFRYSKLLRRVDESDPAIINSIARVYLYKDIVLSGTVAIEAPYSTPLVPAAGDSYITSNSFSYNGETVFIGDESSGIANRRRVFLFKIVGDVRVKVKSNVGYLDTASGTLYLNSFTVQTQSAVRVRVKPATLDIAPKRNQLLNIDMNETSVFGEVDSIAVAGSSGANSYNAYLRDR